MSRSSRKQENQLNHDQTQQVILYKLMESSQIRPCIPVTNYQSCYLENLPESLTITKKVQQIYDSLYKQGTYIWITQDKKQMKFKPSQDSQIKINFIRTIKDVKEYYLPKNQKLVLICHISIIKELEEVLEPLFSASKIKCVVFYGCEKKVRPKLQKYDINISYLDKEQKVFRQISENKKYYTTGNFINFISVEKQKYDSNIMVQTMFSMIKQKTNETQIMKHFKELTQMHYKEEYKQHIQQFFQPYQKYGHLEDNDNKAVLWYTKQSFLHIIVNRILRISKDPTCLYIIQPYFQDLFNNVKKLYQQQHGLGQRYRKFTCYRGGQISDNEIIFFRQNINSFIQNLGYLSTSRDESEAKEFGSNAFFVIIVDDNEKITQMDYGYADLDKISKQNEEQILFNPLNSFKIIKFQEINEEKSKYKYKITLKFGEMGKIGSIQQNLLTQKQLYLKWFREHQRRSSQICNMSYVLFENKHNLPGAQQFCNKYFEIADQYKKREKIAVGHNFKGTILKNKAEYKLAIEQFHKCLKIVQQRQTIGEDLQWKSNMQKIRNEEQILQIKTGVIDNIASSYIKLGQNRKALEYYQRNQLIKKSKFGEYHQKYGTALNNLALCYINLNQYAKAVEYLKQCQQIQQKTKGHNHPEYARTFIDLGLCLNKQGKYQQAEKYLKKSEKIYRQTLGQKHPNYAIALNNLSICCVELKKYKIAVEYLQKCEEIQKQIIGENHPEYAATLNNLAIHYINLGQYQKAMQYLEKCQKIQIQTLGENHKDYLTTLNNLATCFNKLRQYHNAIWYLKRCQEIQRLILGQKSSDYARTLNNLGCTYDCLKEYNKAIDYYKKCLSIRRQQFGENHPEYVKNLKNLGCSCYNMGQKLKAVKILAKCIKIQRNILGVQHPEYYKTLKQLRDILSLMDPFRGSQIMLLNYKNLIFEKKEKGNVGVDKVERDQLYEEISLYYYLDICKQSVVQISQIFDQTFQFQLYYQVLEYIENVDIQGALTALQIVLCMQLECKQLQVQDLRKAIDLLNSLFQIMLDIYNPEIPNFYYRFRQGHMKLKQFLKNVGKVN